MSPTALQPQYTYQDRKLYLCSGTARFIEIVPRGGPPLKMGGPTLEFIDLQPLKRGSPSYIHQYTALQKVVGL